MSKFKYGERVEVRDDDDQDWVEATFVQKVVNITYWTKEPGSPWCGWEQIRKIDPDKNEDTPPPFPPSVYTIAP